MRLHLRFISLAALLLAATAVSLSAQEPNGSPEVDAHSTGVSSPRDIPISAFAGKSQLSSARLSENGSRFAFISWQGEKLILSIHNSDSRDQIAAVDLGTGNEFRWFRWAGDNRVLISIRSHAAGFLFLPISRLMVYDIETQEARYIGFDRQGLEGDDILHIDPAGRHVILSVSKRAFRNPEVWRFPLDGSGEDGAERILKSQKDVDEWWADDQGVVRLGMSFTTGGSVKIFYRPDASSNFERVTKLKNDDEAGRDAWDVMGIYAGRDSGFAMVDSGDGRTILREIDYPTGQLGRIVWENPRWGLDKVMMKPGVGPLGVTFTDDEPQTEWFDPAMNRWQKALEAVLPGSRIEIIDRSGTERMLVVQSGSSDPGALYVFTPAEGRLDLFANLRPQIDETQLSETSAHSIRARDGASFRAFLTLPQGREPRNLPMIIMPHGGPYGIRDTMVYDDWTQLLASRGYAVLRPNYRGSGGYGDAFEQLGDGQIGRAMQDDLGDAMDWAVGEGYADPSRICLYGASYGGYASMWGVIRNPERWRCGASFAGVTDWEDLLKYDREYFGRHLMGRRNYKEWVPRITGDEEFDLSTISVTDQISRLKRPLFVAHGTSDRRVPISQFEDLVSKATKTGAAIETLELDDNHNLLKEEEELKFLEALVAFLEKHNPPFAE